MDQKIPQAQVKNPDILTLTPLLPNRIRISAKTMGKTQVNLWGEDGKLHTIDVVVYGNAEELALILRATFPNTNLKVVPVWNGIMISGTVDKAEHMARIVKIAQEYGPKVISNMTVGVGGEQPAGQPKAVAAETKDDNTPVSSVVEEKQTPSAKQSQMHPHEKTSEKPTSAPTPPLRQTPVGLVVDKNNIIWDNGKPVGVWGVDDMGVRPTKSPR